MISLCWLDSRYASLPRPAFASSTAAARESADKIGPADRRAVLDDTTLGALAVGELGRGPRHVDGRPAARAACSVTPKEIATASESLSSPRRRSEYRCLYRRYARVTSAWSVPWKPASSANASIWTLVAK